MGHLVRQTASMEIRVLGEEDAAAYWALRLEALETEPLAFGSAVEEHQATTVEDAAARIRSLPPGSFILGGFDDGLLVAIATFYRECGIKERHKGHIFGVYVSSSLRGKGMGKGLLQVLLRRAKEDASLEQVLLGVGTYNQPAFQTYKKLGFEVYGTEARALKVGTEYVDEHQMVLNIR